MKTAKDIEEFVRNTSFRAGPGLHRRTIDDALEAQNRSRRAALARHRTNVWRILMKNNIRKLAAAVLVVVLFVGLLQFGGAGAALAKTTTVLRTTLAGLRNFVADMRGREPDAPAVISPARPATQSAGIQGKIISAKVAEFVASPESESLRTFLEAENIKFSSVADSPNASYAVLDPDKIEQFADFAGADTGLTLRSSPTLMLREGQEGTLGIFGPEDRDVVALSLLATVQDEGERIVLSFSFLRGQDGFELPSLDIKIGDAVLFRFDPAASAGNTEDETLVLVRIKVQSPG